MMKAKKVIFLTLVLALLVSTTAVDAATLSATAANSPWTVQLLKGGEDGVRNLATAFVGKFQTPMLSYSRVGLHRIYQAYAATSAVPGNCGPNSTWYCTYWNDSALVPGTVSNMATGLYGPDSFGVKWVYQAGGYLRGATVERMNDMTPVTDDWEDLIQLSKFGGVLVGTPSLQMVGGHFRLAAIIRGGGDFPVYSLVYMYYIGNVANNTCKVSGFAYQCDVISTSVGYNSMGSPSFQMAPDGTVGIAYYYVKELKYAYPHTNTVHWPSNCGPGGNTWRCISIFAGTPTGTVGQVVKFAFGPTGSDRGIVFTYDDTLIEVTLKHAEYVGSGGNCGSDKNRFGVTALRWKCTDVAILGDLASWYTPSFSIAVDPQGYSVIAYNDDPGDLAPVYLYVAYPKERVGIAGPGWIAQKIDGPPVTEVATGAQAALSLNSTGLGFIGYLQEEDYELPDLKIAWQQFQIFLPLIKR
jgi:hypothetical protein